ncbi:oxygenase MpaB family protein [Kineococcus terrestris]|uniref:oxygenase MpaB family protein n=1 Tax=Kineococcus terrestris TaxID=2044856 RepID=UPI0034DB045B
MTARVRLPLRAALPAPPPPGRPGDPGVVPPHGAAWAVLAERALLLGAPAALLLQLAAPPVAAAVAVHSRFREDPGHRLTATLDAVLTVVFGDTEQAAAVGRHVGRRHTGVPRADDPQLGLWVHATLVRTALDVTARYLRRPVDEAFREAYWRETRPFAAALGVPAEVLPPTAAAFDAWWDAALARAEVTAAAREVADHLLSTPTSPPLPGLGVVARAVTADLLPGHLAAEYGLVPGPGRRALAAAVRGATATARPLLPARLARWPHLALAEQRLAARGAPTMS